MICSTLRKAAPRAVALLSFTLTGDGLCSPRVVYVTLETLQRG